MSHTDQLDESVTVATDMADLLRPRLSHDDRDTVPLYGMLLLSAEITAARQGNGALAQSLHEEALAATNRIGSAYQGHHTFFGLANVEVHRVSALVRLSEGGRAVRHAERIDPTLIAGLPTERRSNFLLDLTDAHTQTRNYHIAIRLLTEADHLAPEEVRCRPLTRRLITALLSTAPGGTDPQLRHIARRAGVTT